MNVKVVQWLLSAMKQVNNEWKLLAVVVFPHHIPLVFYNLPSDGMAVVGKREVLILVRSTNVLSPRRAIIHIV